MPHAGSTWLIARLCPSPPVDEPVDPALSHATPHTLYTPPHVALLLLCSVGLLPPRCIGPPHFPSHTTKSLSFAIFSWEPAWAQRPTSPAEHTFDAVVLNAVWQCELSLRLRTYWRMGCTSCARWCSLNAFSILCAGSGFVMLNLNPLLLDFFFLGAWLWAGAGVPDGEPLPVGARL